MSVYTADSGTFKGKTVFIIGGGPSLSGFDWDVLKGKPVIGCNTAFKLGADVCPICFFGDIQFLNKNADELKRYEGTLITNHPSFYKSTCPWLHVMERLPKGLSTDPSTLAWNNNSGAAAINLALLLGAKRVYLLGFDGAVPKDKPNWHDESAMAYNENVYPRHAEALALVARLQQEHFPDASIHNLNPHSRIECFPKKELKKYPHLPLEIQ